MGANTQQIQMFMEKRQSKREQIEAMRSKVRELIQEASNVDSAILDPQEDKELTLGGH